LTCRTALLLSLGLININLIVYVFIRLTNGFFIISFKARIPFKAAAASQFAIFIL